MNLKIKFTFSDNCTLDVICLRNDFYVIADNLCDHSTIDKLCGIDKLYMYSGTEVFTLLTNYGIQSLVYEHPEDLKIPIAYKHIRSIRDTINHFPFDFELSDDVCLYTLIQKPNNKFLKFIFTTDKTYSVHDTMQDIVSLKITKLDKFTLKKV